MDTIAEIGYVFDVEIRYETHYYPIGKKGYPTTGNSDVSAMRSVTGLVISEFPDGRDVAKLMSIGDLSSSYDLAGEIKNGGIDSLSEYILNLELVSARLIGAAKGRKPYGS